MFKNSSKSSPANNRRRQIDQHNLACNIRMVVRWLLLILQNINTPRKKERHDTTNCNIFLIKKTVLECNFTCNLHILSILIVFGFVASLTEGQDKIFSTQCFM